jgi:antitoxin MazE
MKVDIIHIGNSKGVRIPKAILEQCGFKNSVTMHVKDHTLILVPYEEETPRKGWETQFKMMAEQGDDTLLEPLILDHSWDTDEWTW